MDIEEAKKNLKGIDIRNFLSGMSEQSNYILDRAEETNEAIETVLSELEKKDTVISEYEKECRQFKSFCKRVRRDEKRDVDEFNQGQELKCNQFLNLLYGEEHWSYEGKYFDETDKQVDKLFKKAE